MSVKISDKYLLAKEVGYFEVYLIAPPENVPELSGYVMKIKTEKVDIDKSEHRIELLDGNIWDKKLFKFQYMFEKAEKIKGERSKRYRYTEDELVILYGSAKSDTFLERYKKRSATFSSGSGNLVRCKYMDYDRIYGEHEVTKWLIEPDTSRKWVYEFDYDPLRDIGKHNKDAKGFQLLDKYHVDDISILIDNSFQLKRLFRDFEDVYALTFYSYQRMDECHFTERIVDTALKFVPDTVRFRKSCGALYDTKYSEELKEKLSAYSIEIEKECKRTIETCRRDKLTEIISKINDIINIEIRWE